MVQDEHSLWRENIPAYALGALDAEDARALEAHLQTCAACQAELADYRKISESLLMTLPPRQPSPALRKRLQSRLPSAQPAQETRRPRFVWSFGQLALAGALVLLFVAVIAWNLPRINAAQTYQIWWIEPNGHRISAGIFRPQADLPYTTQPCFSSQSVSNFVGLGVTIEPAGGSAQPTGPRVFKVNF